MKKTFWTFMAVVGLFVAVGAGTVGAHEGRIVLKNNTLVCEGISVWKDSRYRITGRCSGLVYPYQERLDNYVLWVRTGQENPKRVGTINLGYFDASSSDTFDQILISVEGDTTTRRPSDIILATSGVQPFDFSPAATTTITTPSVIRQPTPTPTVKAAELNTSILSTGLKRGAAAIAIILGVVIAIAVAMLIVRRSN